MGVRFRLPTANTHTRPKLDMPETPPHNKCGRYKQLPAISECRLGQNS